MAGWGRFPLVVAEALKREGKQVFCIALHGHADPALRDICDEYYPCAVARLGSQIRFFRRHGVSQATLAGKLFKHKLLFGRFGWLGLIPDFRTICSVVVPFFITRRKNNNDDSLLGVVVEEFARDGITLAPATDFAPELLVKPGPLTRRQPTASQRQDIQFGWRLAKELGRLDIGQSVIVNARAVIAVEAIEGTDECIRRAGQLCPLGGFTLVKVAKPQQDMRFDVPTIGLGTVEALIAAKGSVLAIEAGKTIIIDQRQVVELADRHGLVIVAWEGEPARE